MEDSQGRGSAPVVVWQVGEERKAAVLCGEHPTQPVVNPGTLYR